LPALMSEFAVTYAATIFPVKFNEVPKYPTADTLPPVMLPVAEIRPPVRMFPPVTLPLSDAVVPVCVVALTLAPPRDVTTSDVASC
jgi:hypothetical protein